METESLLNALAHTLAEMEPKKLGDTVTNVKGIVYRMRS